MRKLWKGMFMAPHLWEGIYMAARAGYDATGGMLMGRGGEKGELLEHPELWSNVQEALDRTGLFLSGLGNCIIDDNENLHPFGMGPSPDPESMREMFEFAADHGWKGGVQTSIWTTNKDLAIEKFAKICDVTADYGLTVNLEFVAWAVCDTLAKAREILEAVNKPNARITLDLMHLYYMDVKPEEIAACPPEWFGEYHICDMPHVEFPTEKEALAKEGRSCRLFPGESGIDLTKWIRVIPDTVLVTPEIPNRERTQKWGSFEYACRTLEACKDYYRNNNIPL